MPFIRIESLPFEQPLDLPSIVRAVNRELAEKCTIPLEHLHTRWTFLPGGCYAKGDMSPDYQPELGHPLIVELLTPDNYEDTTVITMLETIATSLAQQANFPQHNIFIHHRTAASGKVYDDGKVVTW